MKNVILNGIKKKAKWYQRIFFFIFKDLLYYAYRKGMIDCFKYYNK